MQILFSLATNPERLLRLIRRLLDKGATVESIARFQHETCLGVGNFDLDLARIIKDPNPDACQQVQIYLCNDSPDLDLIKELLSAGATLSDSCDEADLIVCDQSSVARMERQWPQSLVVAEEELTQLFRAEAGCELLQARVDPDLSPVPALPSAIRPAWSRLKKHSIEAIQEGLELFSEVVASDPVAGDPLLDQVCVRGGVLYPGKRFYLTDWKTHPYSYYALLGILSRSPAGSRGSALRGAVERLIDPYDERSLYFRYWSTASDATLVVAALPELHGFNRLSEIQLHVLAAGQKSGPDRFSAKWGELLSLRTLQFEAEPLVALELDRLSATGLQSLRLAGRRLSSIEGLAACRQMACINLENTGVSDLSPLSSLHHTCRELILNQTKITSLKPLNQFRELDLFEINGCESLPSFDSVSQLTLLQSELRLCGSSLQSLEGMPTLAGESLWLDSLPISDLKGIESAQQVKELRLHSLDHLHSIDWLAELKNLEQVFITDCPLLASVSVLGRLPNLRHVILADCMTLKEAPEQWPVSLVHLEARRMPLKRLGRLPSTMNGEIDLTELPQITSLRDLEISTSLSEIAVSLSVLKRMQDLDVLSGYQQLWLLVDMEDQSSLPSSLIEALAQMPLCRLRLSNYQNLNLAPLTAITGLRGLDLEEYSDRVTASTLIPIIGMSQLEYLQVPAGSVPEFGGCTFVGSHKIAKLKLQLLSLS